MRFTESVSDETLKRISDEVIEIAITRHGLLVWNEEGQHLSNEEIASIKQDVFEVLTTPTFTTTGPVDSGSFTTKGPI